MKSSSYSSLSYPYTCMANISDVKAVPSAAIGRWENEGGAPGRPERDKVISWFVPPIVVVEAVMSVGFTRLKFDSVCAVVM